MNFLLGFMVILIASQFQEIRGHGMLIDPVNRASAYRFNYSTQVNYDDDENFCGGFGVQFDKNMGKCGVCGDNYALSQPRPNENGGIYGNGIIVRRYKKGQNITAKVRITANHKGKFWFSICKLKKETDIETEDCFLQHPIKLANGSENFVLEDDLKDDIPIKLTLPADLTCEHCVLRWHWVAGNNWGYCGDLVDRPGCGNQETWRTCSDISIE